MDPLAFPIFTLIFKLVVSSFDTLMDAVNGEFVRSISLIALVIETLYITHYGFLIAFELRTENSDEANITELLYHIVVVIVVLGLLNAPAGVTPLDAFMALRRMLMVGLIGDASSNVAPIGEQVHTALGLLDTAFSAGGMFDTILRAANSTSVMLDTPQLKSTAVTLALVSDISPQISAGILLLLNELMVRLGIALFPLVFYGILYDVSRGFFYTWLEVMFSASIQLSVSLVLIKAATIITTAFVVIFTGLATAGVLAGSSSVGGAVISELQASVIQAGFGLTLSALLFWVPTNMASFAGKIINDSVLKQSLGTPVTARGVQYVRRANQASPRAKEMAIPNLSNRSVWRRGATLLSSNRSVSSGLSQTNDAGIPAFIEFPSIDTVPSDGSVSTQGSNKSRGNQSLAGYGDVSVSTQGSNKSSSNQSIAGYSNASVSSIGSSNSSINSQSRAGYDNVSRPFKQLFKPFNRLLNKSDIPTFIAYAPVANRDSKGDANTLKTVVIASRMDSKPPALLEGSLQIPMARAVRFGAGDDESSSARLMSNLRNNPTNNDVQLNVRLFMQKIKRDGTPRTIRNAEGQWVLYGRNACWFASLKMVNSYHSPVVASVFLRSNTQASNRLKNILVKDEGISFKDIKLLTKVEKLIPLDTQYINTFSIANLSKALKQYGPIWAPLKRIKLKSGGHVVVITGIKDNSIIFNDPAKSAQQIRPFEWFYERMRSTHHMLLVKNTIKNTAKDVVPIKADVNTSATVVIARKMDSKPLALVEGSLHIPLARTVRFGAGDDERIGNSNVNNPPRPLPAPPRLASVRDTLTNSDFDNTVNYFLEPTSPRGSGNGENILRLRGGGSDDESQGNQGNAKRQRIEQNSIAMVFDAVKNTFDKKLAAANTSKELKTLFTNIKRNHQKEKSRNKSNPGYTDKNCLSKIAEIEDKVNVNFDNAHNKGQLDDEATDWLKTANNMTEGLKELTKQSDHLKVRSLLINLKLNELVLSDEISAIAPQKIAQYKKTHKQNQTILLNQLITLNNLRPTAALEKNKELKDFFRIARGTHYTQRSRNKSRPDYVDRDYLSKINKIENEVKVNFDNATDAGQLDDKAMNWLKIANDMTARVKEFTKQSEQLEVRSLIVNLKLNELVLSGEISAIASQKIAQYKETHKKQQTTLLNQLITLNNLRTTADLKTNKELKDSFRRAKKNNYTQKSKNKSRPDYVDKSYLSKITEIEKKVEVNFDNAHNKGQLDDKAMFWLKTANAMTARVQEFTKQSEQLEVRSLIVNLKLNELVLSGEVSAIAPKKLRQYKDSHKQIQTILLDNLIILNKLLPTAAAPATIVNQPSGTSVSSSDSTPEGDRKPAARDTGVRQNTSPTGLQVSAHKQLNTSTALIANNQHSDHLDIDPDIVNILENMSVGSTGLNRSDSSSKRSSTASNTSINIFSFIDMPEDKSTGSIASNRSDGSQSRLINGLFDSPSRRSSVGSELSIESQGNAKRQRIEQNSIATVPEWVKATFDSKLEKAKTNIELKTLFVKTKENYQKEKSRNKNKPNYINKQHLSNINKIENKVQVDFDNARDAGQLDDKAIVWLKTANDMTKRLEEFTKENDKFKACSLITMLQLNELLLLDKTNTVKKIATYERQQKEYSSKLDRYLKQLGTPQQAEAGERQGNTTSPTGLQLSVYEQGIAAVPEWLKTTFDSQLEKAKTNVELKVLFAEIRKHHQTIQSNNRKNPDSINYTYLYQFSKIKPRIELNFDNARDTGQLKGASMLWLETAKNITARLEEFTKESDKFEARSLITMLQLSELLLLDKANTAAKKVTYKREQTRFLNKLDAYLNELNELNFLKSTAPANQIIIDNDMNTNYSPLTRRGSGASNASTIDSITLNVINHINDESTTMFENKSTKSVNSIRSDLPSRRGSVGFELPIDSRGSVKRQRVEKNSIATVSSAVKNRFDKKLAAANTSKELKDLFEKVRRSYQKEKSNKRKNSKYINYLRLYQLDEIKPKIESNFKNARDAGQLDDKAMVWLETAKNITARLEEFTKENDKLEVRLLIINLKLNELVLLNKANTAKEKSNYKQQKTNFLKTLNTHLNRLNTAQQAVAAVRVTAPVVEIVNNQQIAHLNVDPDRLEDMSIKSIGSAFSGGTELLDDLPAPIPKRDSNDSNL